MNNDVKLTLSINETNLLLESLGQMPFIRVHDLIYKIRSQAGEQLQEAKPEGAEPDSES